MNNEDYTYQEIGFKVSPIHNTQMFNAIKSLMSLQFAVEQMNPTNLADFIDTQFPRLSSEERLTLMVLYETLYIETQFSKGFR